MGAFLPNTARYIRLALGKGEAAGRGQQRYVSIVRGIFSGLAGRGVSVLVSFFAVPLTVRYLGPERYGAWVTISTALAWVTVADLGLSNSLTNAVSEGFAKESHDLAADYVAAGFWSMVAIAVLLTAVFFAIWPHIAWDRVFNVTSAQARAEVGPAVAIAFVIFALNFPFSIVTKVYGAYQQVTIANGWAAAGSVLSLVGLIVVTRLEGGLQLLVVALSGSLLVVNIISAVWLFGWSKPWLLPRLGRVRRFAVRKLTSLGGMFFIVQVAGLLLFQTDNLIIAHYLGAAAVTPYSVTWRLFSYTMIFQTLARPSYWPAYAEAFNRGDYAWVRRTFRMDFRITVVSTLCLAIPLVLVGQWVIGKWAGSAAVPPFSLLPWMGLWCVIFAATCSQSCILASSSRLRGQAMYSITAAIVNIAASVALVQRMGVTGAILGTIAAYVTCILLPQWIEVRRALREPACA